MSFPNSPTGMHAFWMGVGCLKFMAVMAWTQRRGLGRERQSVSAWNKPRFQTRGNYGNPSQSSDPLLLCVRPCSRQRIRQWRKEIKALPSGILQSGRKTTDQKQTHAPWRRMLRGKLQQSKRLGKAEGGSECNLQWACRIPEQGTLSESLEEARSRLLEESSRWGERRVQRPRGRGCLTCLRAGEEDSVARAEWVWTDQQKGPEEAGLY